MEHEVNCRNFKCPTNDGHGGCTATRLEFVPIGGPLDRLICVQCDREGADEKLREQEKGGATNTNDH